jgi:hypothetical protein
MGDRISSCAACVLAAKRRLDQWHRNFVHDLAAAGVSGALLARAADLAARDQERAAA